MKGFAFNAPVDLWAEEFESDFNADSDDFNGDLGDFNADSGVETDEPDVGTPEDDDQSLEMYTRPQFQWNFNTPSAINSVTVNGETTAYVVRTFDSSSQSVPNTTKYYDPVPLNIPWYTCVYNHLVMAAVRKCNPRRVILSRCALYNPESKCCIKRTA